MVNRVGTRPGRGHRVGDRPGVVPDGVAVGEALIINPRCGGLRRPGAGLGIRLGGRRGLGVRSQLLPRSGRGDRLVARTTAGPHARAQADERDDGNKNDESTNKLPRLGQHETTTPARTSARHTGGGASF